MCLVFSGCDFLNPTPYVPQPVPIELGLVECPECCGDGKIDLEKKSVHCPKCDGLGRMNEVEIGVLEPYSTEFARGYRDYHDNVPYEKPAYLLKIRYKEWQKGWLEAKKEADKKFLPPVVMP